MSDYSVSFFDRVIDRQGTHSIKTEELLKIYGEPDLIPMWVADMDFRVAHEISRAIIHRAGHEIYGYTFRPGSFFQSAADWVYRRHGWTIPPGWMTFSPGIVPALNFSVLAFTQPGDKIIVQPPVYPPFFSAVSDHGRQLVFNPLIHNGENYEIDFDHLENVIDPKTKMLILCHPHNPVGRVWTVNELEKLAEICIRHRIIVICDMIHADLIINKMPCPSLAGIDPEIADLTITCIAPSKTFNIAGLNTSLVISSNPVMKKQFENVVNKLHLGLSNIFGMTAAEAAYKYGDKWLDGLLAYISKNFDLLDRWVSSVNFVRYIRPQATYLAWLDFSPAGLAGDQLYKKMIYGAKVGMNKGIEFGAGNESYMRMNLACPASVVKKAIRQINNAMS